MILGLARGRVHDYIPEGDRGNPRPTRFRVKTPTAEQFAMIQDQLSPRVHGEMQLALGAASVLALRLCLVGWDNFGALSEAGEVEPLAFQGSPEAGPKPEDLDRIPGSLRLELYRFIRSLGEVSQEDFPRSALPPG